MSGSGGFFGCVDCRMASLLCVVRQAHHERRWVGCTISEASRTGISFAFPGSLQSTHFPHGELCRTTHSSIAIKTISSLGQKQSWPFIHASKTSSYSIPVLSMGSCFRSRSKVGKDGVSAGGQRTQALADLFVFGGQSAHFRQILPPLLTPTPIVRTLHRRRRWARTSRRSSTRPAEQAEAGRQGDNVSGRSSDRTPYLQRRASTTARLPSMQAMARLRMRAWQGENLASTKQLTYR